MRTLALALVALSLAVPDRERGNVKDDRDLLQGRWQVLTYTDGGQDYPEDRQNQVEIGRERYTIKRGGKVLESLPYQLDFSKNPKWIDFTVGTQVRRGIYELSGDFLSICFNERPGGERPTAFASMLDSSNDVLVTFKRLR